MGRVLNSSEENRSEASDSLYVEKPTYAQLVCDLVSGRWAGRPVRVCGVVRERTISNALTSSRCSSPQCSISALLEETPGMDYGPFFVHGLHVFVGWFFGLPDRLHRFWSWRKEGKTTLKIKGVVRTRCSLSTSTRWRCRDLGDGFSGGSPAHRAETQIGFLRFYDPNLQRWPNRDPLSTIVVLSLRKGTAANLNEELVVGPNLYLLCRNAPTRYVDYCGLACGADAPWYSPGSDAQVPDHPMGFDFSQACQNHDDCYGKCGSSKSQCDQGLLDDAKRKCDSYKDLANPGFCKLLAYTYYAVVKFGGDDAFREGQRIACPKKPCPPPEYRAPPGPGGPPDPPIRWIY